MRFVVLFGYADHGVADDGTVGGAEEALADDFNDVIALGAFLFGVVNSLVVLRIELLAEGLHGADVHALEHVQKCFERHLHAVHEFVGCPLRLQREGQLIVHRQKGGRSLRTGAVVGRFQLGTGMTAMAFEFPEKRLILHLRFGQLGAQFIPFLPDIQPHFAISFHSNSGIIRQKCELKMDRTRFDHETLADEALFANVSLDLKQGFNCILYPWE